MNDAVELALVGVSDLDLWPSRFYCVTSFGTSVSATVAFRAYPSGTASTHAAIAKKWRGVDSGQIADFRNTPLTGKYSVSVSPEPACVATMVNLHDVNGNAVTATPGWGYNIWEFNGVSAIATMQSYTSWYYLPPPDDVCFRSGDAPTLPAFIQGEFIEEVA